MKKLILLNCLLLLLGCISLTSCEDTDILPVPNCPYTVYFKDGTNLILMLPCDSTKIELYGSNNALYVKPTISKGKKTGDIFTT